MPSAQKHTTGDVRAQGVHISADKCESLGIVHQEVATQDDLKHKSISSLRVHPHYETILHDRKDEINKILQGVIDIMNERLARGEEVCSKVHFPLINECEFEDMEQLCNRDFTVNISQDVVDKVLRDLAEEFITLIYDQITIENTEQSNFLERTAQALIDRFDTLEQQMQERTTQLSKCRYAYFLELTHLRTQVYGIDNEGEKFEITEAYWFDPADYLDEDLRNMLNDKIKLSVKMWFDKYCLLLKDNEDMKTKMDVLTIEMEQIRNGSRRANGEDEDKVVEKEIIVEVPVPGVPDDITDAVELMFEKFPCYKILEEIKTLRPDEFEEMFKQDLEVDSMRQRMSDLEDKLFNEKEARQRAEDELEALKMNQAREMERLQEEMRKSQMGGDGGGLDGAEMHAALQTAQDELADWTKRGEAAEGKLAMVEEELTKIRNALEEATQKIADLTEELETLRSQMEEMTGSSGGKMKGSMQEMSAKNAELQDALDDTRAEMEKLRGLQEAMDKLREECADIQKEREDYRKLAEEAQAQVDSLENTLESIKLDAVAAFKPPTAEVEVQSNIVGNEDGFYMMEYPSHEGLLAVEMELEDMTSCALSSWATTLDRIRASRRPPHGYGSGFVRANTVTRLFRGGMQRVNRLEELIKMSQTLQRSELEKVLSGVNLLQESTLPDHSVHARSFLFGKGFSIKNLREKQGKDFQDMVNSWSNNLKGLVGVIMEYGTEENERSIELGVHNGRRIFVPAKKHSLQTQQTVVSNRVDSMDLEDEFHDYTAEVAAAFEPRQSKHSHTVAQFIQSQPGQAPIFPQGGQVEETHDYAVPIVQDEKNEPNGQKKKNVRVSIQEDGGAGMPEHLPNGLVKAPQPKSGLLPEQHPAMGVGIGGASEERMQQPISMQQPRLSKGVVRPPATPMQTEFAEPPMKLMGQVSSQPRHTPLDKSSLKTTGSLQQEESAKHSSARVASPSRPGTAASGGIMLARPGTSASGVRPGTSASAARPGTSGRPGTGASSSAQKKIGFNNFDVAADQFPDHPVGAMERSVRNLIEVNYEYQADQAHQMSGFLPPIDHATGTHNNSKPSVGPGPAMFTQVNSQGISPAGRPMPRQSRPSNSRSSSKKRPNDLQQDFGIDPVCGSPPQPESKFRREHLGHSGSLVKPGRMASPEQHDNRPTLQEAWPSFDSKNGSTNNLFTSVSYEDSSSRRRTPSPPEGRPSPQRRHIGTAPGMGHSRSAANLPNNRSRTPGDGSTFKGGIFHKPPPGWTDPSRSTTTPGTNNPFGNLTKSSSDNSYGTSPSRAQTPALAVQPMGARPSPNGLINAQSLPALHPRHMPDVKSYTRPGHENAYSHQHTPSKDGRLPTLQELVSDRGPNVISGIRVGDSPNQVKRAPKKHVGPILGSLTPLTDNQRNQHRPDENGMEISPPHFKSHGSKQPPRQ